MIPLLLRLHVARDPVHAVFADLKGDPDAVAANVWARLGYLQSVGVISSRLQAAATVAQHVALDPEAGARLLRLVGEEVAAMAVTA